MSSEQDKPRVSIVVPSYKRPKELLELLQALVTQSVRETEIVIVEQSEDPSVVRDVEALNDPRIRIVLRPPLGLPGARNVGIEHARADILLFIDDDDVPLTDDWVQQHLDNYDDPQCLGVVGRLSRSREGDPPPRFPRLVKLAAFRYTMFKDPRTLAFGSLRKEGIDFLTFSGGSIRKALFERVGGFDEGLPLDEEHSFFFRYATIKQPGDYFVYDPRPAIWRRLDVRGGLDRRRKTDWYKKELEGRIFYYHAVVAHYFPTRFKVMYPLLMVRALSRAQSWVWDPDNSAHSFGERLNASIKMLGDFPRAVHDNGFAKVRATVRRGASASQQRS